MPLILKVTKDTATSKYITFEDATGVYDATTNPSGYGAPNPERNTLYIGFVATLKASNADVNLAVTNIPDNSTPLTATDFKLTTGKSGRVKYAIFSAPLYDATAVYTKYDCVWSGSNFYYYTLDSDSTPSAFNTENGWSVMNSPELLVKSTQTTSDGFYYTLTNDFITEGIDLFFLKNGISFFKDRECAVCKGSSNGFDVFTLKVTAQGLAATGNYIEAQDIVEHIENKTSTGTSCGC